MCGIAGYLGDLLEEDGWRLLATMNTALSHRGPDGEGAWLGPGVGLAHRRLAIIDLQGGAQPMACVEGRYQLVFNGEIYNHRALRDELTAAGYRFRTRSDTEVIPAALERFGVEQGLRRLRGMFAFAMYDTRERRLLLARDPVGIKPLYVGRSRGLLLFGSEPKALLAWPHLSRAADPAALLDFFTVGAPFAPRTAFKAITELPPGTWWSCHGGREETGRYWEWSPCPEEGRSEAEWLAELERVLAGSVAAHLESDVPVAAFLSGGVDSSVLVALMCKTLKAPLHTFNVGFDEQAYDESPHARAVARHVGSTHHEFKVNSGDSDPELFRRVVEQYDQPFGDSSCLPTWLISREMACHAKVVISGDGGDEMFGGYMRYTLARKLEHLSRVPIAPTVLDVAGRLLMGFEPDLARKLKKAARFSRANRAERLCLLLAYFTTEELTGLLRPEVQRCLLAEGPTAERFERLIQPSDDPAEQLMSAEIRSLLTADYLRKVDVASSAHGLEVRTPFLDPEVFALSQRLPIAFKLKDGKVKHLLRRLALGLVPPEVVNRAKQGFGIPFDRWASGRMLTFLRDLLAGPDARIGQWVDRERLAPLLVAFERQSSNAEMSRYQMYHRIFMLAAFELWLRRWSPSLT